MLLSDTGLTLYDFSIDILKLKKKALLEIKSNIKELTGSFKYIAISTFIRSSLVNTSIEFLTENPK